VVLIGLYRLAPKVLEALKIITPETVIRWIALVFEPIGAANHVLSVVGQRRQQHGSAADSRHASIRLPRVVLGR
jgi:hypothetical protein